MVTAGAVAVAAGLSQAIWAGISVAERSIGGKSVSLQAFTDDVIIIDLSVG